MCTLVKQCTNKQPSFTVGGSLERLSLMGFVFGHVFSTPELAHQFGVNFGIQSGIADQVYDPSLGLLGGHIQLICQHAAQRQEERWVRGENEKCRDCLRSTSCSSHRQTRDQTVSIKINRRDKRNHQVAPPSQ